MAPTNGVSLRFRKNLHSLIDSLQAFSRISKPILDQLSIPLNYPLLLSLLRNHFIEGEIATALNSSISSATKLTTDIVTVSSEGYPLHLYPQADNFIINNTYYTSSFSANDSIKAANGIVHKISRVLDPYASTFGVSPTSINGTATVVDSSPRQEEKTMTDLVNAEPLLSVWKETISEVLPAIIKRLGDRRGAESASCKNPKPFAVLPQNSAFEMLPKGYINTLRAPFNFVLSSHLLAWGISVPTCASFEDILGKVRKEGRFEIFSHRADLNLTVTEDNGVLMVNNAKVVMANRCAGNGCVWIVERLVDPVFGMF
jgi:uncharacterized surface protein with fasciclin (FAS1) repeats